MFILPADLLAGEIAGVYDSKMIKSQTSTNEFTNQSPKKSTNGMGASMVACTFLSIFFHFDVYSSILAVLILLALIFAGWWDSRYP